MSLLCMAIRRRLIRTETLLYISGTLLLIILSVLIVFRPCCRIVWTCVSSLWNEQGPAMQLLVLTLRLMIPLTLVSPVASTTTGMWSRLWTCWYRVALLTFGSTRLSSIRLTLFPANSLRFLLLSVVVEMLQFLCASRHIKGL